MIASMSVPIWKLNGTCPTATVSLEVGESSAAGSIQQGFMMSMRNTARAPSIGASSSSDKTSLSVQVFKSWLMWRSCGPTV